MPFECYACNKIFCTKHSRPDDHKCTVGGDSESVFVIICPICEMRIRIKASNNPDMAWNAH